MNESTDGGMNELRERGMDGWMDGNVGGLGDGRMEGLADENSVVFKFSPAQLPGWAKNKASVVDGWMD